MKLRHAPNRKPDELRQAVIEEVKNSNGYTTKTQHQIAEQYGVSDWTVRNWAGVQHPNRNNLKAYERRQLMIKDARELHWEGYTYNYIAKQLGIPVSTVWDYINRPYTMG